MNRTADNGFSILEVLVALGVLAIGMTGALALLGSATSSHRVAAAEVDSARIAEAVIAQTALRLTASADPAKLSAQGVPWPDSSGFTYDLVLTGPPKGQEFLAEVRVGWSREGRRMSELYRAVLIRRLAPEDVFGK